MASLDYTEWYNKAPIWLRIVLFPVLIAVMALHSIFMIPVFGTVVLLVMIDGILANRRMWRRLRERGQIGQWKDVEPALQRGTGTLLVEFGHKGPGYSWWINASRDEIDPEHIVPTWQDWEERLLWIFDSAEKPQDAGERALGPIETPESLEAVNKWTVERLSDYESTALVVTPSWAQLRELPDQAKQKSAIAIWSWCNATLSNRFMRRKKTQN